MLRIKPAWYATIGCILLFSVVIMISNSCRKIDFAKEGPSTSTLAANTERFFSTANVRSAFVKQIAGYLERKNEQQEFVSKAIVHAGYPQWDKSLIAMPDQMYQRGNSDSSNGYAIAYIPFVADSSVSTNAVMVIQISPTDTICSTVWPQHYVQFGFDTTAQGWNSRQLFQLFTEFDYSIFHYTKFIVPDGRIFGHGIHDTMRVTRIGYSDRITSSLTSRSNLIAIELCVDYTWEGSNWGIVRSNFYGTITPDVICTTFFWYPEGTETPLPSPFPEGVTWNPPPAPIGEGSSGTWFPEDPYIFFPDHGLAGGSYVFDSDGILHSQNTKTAAFRANMDTSQLDPCTKTIISNLIKATNNSCLAKMLVKLDLAAGEDITVDKFYINFKVKPITNGSLSTTTMLSYDTTTKEFYADITLDSTLIHDGTDLIVAETFIHEMIHAYMDYIKLKAWRTVGATTISDADSAFSDFIRYIFIIDSTNGDIRAAGGDSIHHNTMVNHMLDHMSAMLAAWDGNRIGDPTYYWDLCWNGLTRHQVKAWDSQWPTCPNWPPTNPSVDDNDKRGLTYALTTARFDSIYIKHLPNEVDGLPNAKGRKRGPSGCY